VSDGGGQEPQPCGMVLTITLRRRRRRCPGPRTQRCCPGAQHAL